jgi:Na+/H+ antiporter NhaD/arsenite permease-like protein
MVLIRPYIRANHARQQKAHLIVFFIFIVSNTGGLLTPLGDPPLFLGFLRGVPFHWTLTLLPQWAFAVGFLLVVFNLLDQYVFNREDIATPGALAEEVQPRQRLQVQGRHNLLYLLGVMAAAVMSGYCGWPRGIQESGMILMAVLSRVTTSRAGSFSFLASARAWQGFPGSAGLWPAPEAGETPALPGVGMVDNQKRNGPASRDLDLHPIAEVAAVFLGIFITMIPALEILNARAASLQFGKPWQFFWMSGALSSVLDNAPTYLTFATLAAGRVGGSAENLGSLLHTPLGESLLTAVACGSVFMGANTYIGNGPNFLVMRIAESKKIRMPSFGGYIVYSGLILLPLFALMTLIFFRS